MAESRIDPGGDLRYLGKKGVEFAGLDTFPAPDCALIRMTSDEVTSECPITGQPDFEVVDVTYAPRELAVESKSFKMYLTSLRHTAAFVEALAVNIAHVIAEAIEPQWVRVDVTQKARGGVSIVAVAVLHRNGNEGVPPYIAGSPMIDVSPPRNYYLGH